MDNAVKAAVEDPRFPPLSAAEFAGVELAVSILTPPQPMTFRNETDLLAQLRPLQDGLIIEDLRRRALFLSPLRLGDAAGSSRFPQPPEA